MMYVYMYIISLLYIFPLTVCRLVKEMYLIVPHVERLEDTRKSLQQTINDTCMVRKVDAHMI